ncbi:MAG: hypothetical protein M3261_06240, partial [Thermoproteota archaeon]|nr:hypothetical protein [Thermoproteota archaeon]
MSNRKAHQQELRDGGLVAATGTRGRFAGRRDQSAGLKSHLPDGYRAYLVHYRFSGCGDHTSLPGVERVMDSHRNLLRQLGVTAAILTGETENDQDPHVIVFKPIGILSNGAGGRLSTKEIASNIDAFTHGATTAFHNTTIAYRYNPEYGEAAARLVDASIQGERATAVLWIHDIEQVGLWRFLPRQEGAKVVVASSVVEKRLKKSIKQIQITRGLQMPSYDIHIIPNPIDSSFFTSEVSTPQNIADLAPQFERFTQQYKLPQSAMTTEKILFSGRDYAKFLLSGRIAYNKGIKEAIEAVKSFSEMYQRAILIITNGPDFDIRENENYWRDIKKLISHHSSRKERLQVLLLGGV